jgi:hypothetical protein
MQYKDLINIYFIFKFQQTTLHIKNKKNATKIVTKKLNFANNTFRKFMSKFSISIL